MEADGAWRTEKTLRYRLLLKTQPPTGKGTTRYKGFTSKHRLAETELSQAVWALIVALPP